MKKQRSKSELLKSIHTYQALKKDWQQGKEINRKTAYWRMGVEWSTVLWKEEKFSTNSIAVFLQYIVDNDVTELPEKRRDEIRQMLGDRVEWTLKNTVTQEKKGSVIDQAVNELEFYNTKVCVDYSLLACEYLIKHKGYAKKRLDRVIGAVYYTDGLDASVIWAMRQELFESKGIWIDLDGEEPPEGAQVIRADRIVLADKRSMHNGNSSINRTEDKN